MAQTDTFWIAELKREQLLELVTTRSLATKKVSLAELYDLDVSGSQAIGIWRAPAKPVQSPLPQVVVGEKPVLEDFVAWVATYLPGLTPLTALTRLLTPTSYRETQKRSAKVDWQNLAGPTVALSLGEVLSYVSESVRPSDLGVAMCRGTLSFALMRSAVLGVCEHELDSVATDWANVRKKIGQSTNRRSSEVILKIIRWLAFSDLPTANIRETPSLELLGYKIDLPSVIERYGNSQLSGLTKFEVAGSLTAEDKVEIFDLVVPKLIKDRRYEVLERALILASLAFWCRTGFLQQFSIMRPYATLLPEAALLLGSLQAFEPMAATLSTGQGIGWRLARELFLSEDIFQSPGCDISLLELGVLGRSSNFTEIMASLEKSRIEVELLPGVTTFVRSSHSRLPNQGELFFDRPDEHLELEDQRTEVLGSVERSLERALRDIRKVRWQPRQSRYR